MIALVLHYTRMKTINLAVNHISKLINALIPQPRMSRHHSA
jgi:hypothetical protein